MTDPVQAEKYLRDRLKICYKSVNLENNRVRTRLINKTVELENDQVQKWSSYITTEYKMAELETIELENDRSRKLLRKKTIFFRQRSS